MPLLIHYMMMLRRDIPLPAGWGGAPPPSGKAAARSCRLCVWVLGFYVVCVCSCSWFTGASDLPR